MIHNVKLTVDKDSVGQIFHNNKVFLNVKKVWWERKFFIFKQITHIEIECVYVDGEGELDMSNNE